MKVTFFFTLKRLIIFSVFELNYLTNGPVLWMMKRTVSSFQNQNPTSNNKSLNHKTSSNLVFWPYSWMWLIVTLWYLNLNVNFRYWLTGEVEMTTHLSILIWLLLLRNLESRNYFWKSRRYSEYCYILKIVFFNLYF